MKNTCVYISCVGYKSINVKISNEAFSKRYDGNYMLSETRSAKFEDLKKCNSKRRLIIFRKNLIAMTKFHAIGQMDKIP